MILTEADLLAKNQILRYEHEKNTYSEGPKMLYWNAPVCKNIRTRAKYVPALRDDKFMELHDPFVPYYCVKTLEVIGPDDSPVCPEDCGRNRICYAPLLENVVA